MNLHERVLSVLGCQFVDDVLIDAPYAVTSNLVATLGINEVLHGTVSDGMANKYKRFVTRYKHPIEAGIFTLMESPSHFNVEKIMKKIQTNRGTFEAKFVRKTKAENDYYRKIYAKQ